MEINRLRKRVQQREQRVLLDYPLLERLLKTLEDEDSEKALYAVRHLLHFMETGMFTKRGPEKDKVGLVSKIRLTYAE